MMSSHWMPVLHQVFDINEIFETHATDYRDRLLLELLNNRPANLQGYLLIKASAWRIYSE